MPKELLFSAFPKKLKKASLEDFLEKSSEPIEKPPLDNFSARGVKNTYLDQSKASLWSTYIDTFMAFINDSPYAKELKARGLESPRSAEGREKESSDSARAFWMGRVT